MESQAIIEHNMPPVTYRSIDDDESSLHTQDITGKNPTTTWFVYILTIAATLSGFLMGYVIGVVSGAVLFIKPYFHLDIIWIEAIVSVTIAAASLFSLTSGYMADKFGRKKVIMFSSVAFAVGSIVKGVAYSKETLLAGRIIVGIGMGYSITIVPMYIAEAAPAYNRGRLVTLNQLFVTIGILVASLVVGAFSEITDGWRYMLSLSGVAAVIQFLVFLFLPESCRWLVSQGRDLEARAVLEKIRGTPDNNREFNEIQESVLEGRLRSERYVITRIFSTPHIRRALAVGCMLMFFNQMCGINTVIYYSATIMRKAGFTVKYATWLVAAPNAVNFVSTFFGLWLVERIGRRLLTLISITGVCLALGVLALGFQLTWMHIPSVNHTDPFSNKTLVNISCDSYTNCDSCTDNTNCGFCYNVTSVGYCLPVNTTTQLSQFAPCTTTPSKFQFYIGFCPSHFMWMAVVGMVLFVFSFAPGLGPMPSTVNAEIYPLWARATCVSISQFVNWSCNLLVSFTFLTFTETINTYCTFWMYTVMSVLGLVLLAKYLPETKDKTLEQVELVFMSDIEKRERLFRENATAEQD